MEMLNYSMKIEAKDIHLLVNNVIEDILHGRRHPKTLKLKSSFQKFYKSDGQGEKENSAM